MALRSRGMSAYAERPGSSMFHLLTSKFEPGYRARNATPATAPVVKDCLPIIGTPIRLGRVQ
jgi:hypothetical protein